MSDDIIKITFGDPEEPLAELAPYEQNSLDRYEQLPLNEAQRANLSVFVQHAPALAYSTRDAIARTYTLRFASDVQRQIRSGAARIVESTSTNGLRAAAVDKSGKIIGQGTLKAAKGARAVASVTAMWQVMAVVTAQVYLAEINNRLVEIELGISQIKRWLESDKIATLMNAYSYVWEMHEAFTHRTLTERDIALFEQQLESLWVACGQVAIHLQLARREQEQSFAQLDLGSLWSLDHKVAKAKRAIEQYERLTQAQVLAIQTRAVLVRSRTVLPLSDEVTAQRTALLQGEIDSLHVENRQFLDRVRKHTKNHLRAKLSIKKKNTKYQGKVLGTASEVSARMSAHAEDARVALKELQAHQEQQLRLAAQPYTLVVTVDKQGNVTESYRLLEG